MVVVCPRCRRASPAGALYCYFDGAALNQGPVSAALPVTTFAQDFVFPSGTRCRTLDELVLACYAEWDQARGLLRRGDIGRHLGRLGRLDLAHAAEQAQQEADADLALINFLNVLPPPQTTEVPRLALDPRRMNLSGLKPGDRKHVRFLVLNRGKGQLQGKIKVGAGADWLRIAADADNDTDEIALQAAQDQQVTLTLNGAGLKGGQRYQGKLLVISNGGIAELPIRLDAAVIPFPKGPFQGADSPRALAERMRQRDAARAAVPLLENGDIARWFAANGWSYPVPGAAARGVGAVQQFFECMGVSKPPPLEVRPKEQAFNCRSPGVQRGQAELLTASKKWVYAQVDSDAPWLRVLTPSVSGPQQAKIDYEVDGDALPESRAYEGKLTIRANAGQRFEVRVLADARRPQESPLLKLLRPVLVGALLFLLLRLLLALPADVFARWLAVAALRPEATEPASVAASWLVPDPGPDPAPGGLARWRLPLAEQRGFLKRFVLATWWLGAPIGVWLVRRRGGGLRDLFAAVVAGGAAGLAVFATLGSVLLLLDAPVRLVLGVLAGTHLSAFVALPLCVLLAAAFWAVLGGGLGVVLGVMGRRGTRVLATLAAPLSGTLRALGLGGPADFFAFRAG